jgi:hypothetical protein
MVKSPAYDKKQQSQYNRHTVSRSHDRNRGQLKCGGTSADTRFRLSAKRTCPFKTAGTSVQSTLAVEVCASAVVMLDTPCPEVVWRVLATYSIRQFPLHFHSIASPCTITFQLESTSEASPILITAIFGEKRNFEPLLRTLWDPTLFTNHFLG